MPVVYIDVVWLVNFVMDAILLAVTGWILRRPVRLQRIVLGALTGSTYALLLFFPSLSTLTTWPGKALVSLVMVAIALPWRNWLDLARNGALFYTVTFVFAGAAIALHFALPGVTIAKGTVISSNRLAFVISLQSLCLIIAVPLAAACFRYGVRFYRQVALAQRKLYTVHVTIAGVEVSFTGLMDTGNQLYDPVSRKPVCLVEAEVLAPVLPPPLCEALSGGADGFAAMARVTDRQWSNRFAVVPFRGAGGVQQVAIAVRPDEVRLEHEGRQILAGPCLLALHPPRLSVDRRFQAILHTDLITGDDRVEDTVHQKQADVAAAVATVVDPASVEGRGGQ